MKKFKRLFFIINLLIGMTPFLSIYAHSDLFSSEMSGEYKQYLRDLERKIIDLEEHPFAYYEASKTHEYSIGHWALYVDLDPTEILKNLAFMLEGYIRMLFAQKEYPESGEIIGKLIQRIIKINRSIQLLSRQKEKDLLSQNGEKDKFYYKLRKILKLWDIKQLIKQTHQILENSYDSRYGKPFSYEELSKISKAFTSGKFRVNPDKVTEYVDALIKSQDAGLIKITPLKPNQKIVISKKIIEYDYPVWLIYDNHSDVCEKCFCLPKKLSLYIEKLRIIHE
jgi:hypothetical protein